MNRFVVVGLAAGAVLLVAFIGIQLMGGSNVGGPPPTPIATESPQADSPIPSPTAPSADFPSEGPIAAGRHSMILEGVQLSIEMPNTGWQSNGEFRIWRNAGTSSFIFWTTTPDGVYTDPCAGVQGPVIGSEIAALAAAVAALPGTDLVAGPSDVTIGGRPAKHVALTIREDVECGTDEQPMLLWYDEGSGGRWPDSLGDDIRVWIIDTGDAVVWIDAETPPDATGMVQEMLQVVESIQFE